MGVDVDRVEQVFHEALALPERGAREAFLKEACGEDAALRGRVERLLAAAEEAESAFLATESIVAPVGPAGGTVGVRERVGMMIGPYKLLQQIGEGGFGVVFMAEQEKPLRRKVALKIIKLGMDTHQVVARFEAERQALALMEHPNIAKVLDAGETETGRPYFVMELVKGIPITAYCDQQKLDTTRRVELFIEVCLAVQHAHQKGIIHRDIKPSNVLVTMRDDKPVPKVIDFGIAKATQARLTERTLFTEFQQMMGTPAYMSPEQAQMNELDVDTRSDIYSLGVLLYELLTGTTPFEKETLMRAALGEIQRMIREVEPPKPSTRLGTLPGEKLETVAKGRGCDGAALSRMMRGDLDWIIMKCLEKDRTRRYETANGLARDLQRHLVDEPVEAGPPSMMYRLGKVMRRNRGAMLAAGVVTLTLFLAVVVSTGRALAGVLAVAVALFAGFVVSVAMLRKALRAEQEQARLRGEAESARGEAEKAREMEVREREKAQRRFEEVQKLARVLMFDLQDKVTDLQGSTPAMELMARTAQRYLEVLSAEAEGDVSLQEDLAQAYKKMGDIQGNPHRAASLCDYPAAMESYQKSLALHEALLKKNETSYVNLRGKGMAHGLIGAIHFLSADSAAAMARYGEARNVFEQLVSLHPKSIQARIDLAESIRLISEVQVAMGEGKSALESMHQVKDLYFRLGFLEMSQEEQDQLQGRVASVYMDIAGLLLLQGRTVNALECYNKCLTEFSGLLAANPAHARARRAVAVSHMGIGSVLCRLGDAIGAQEEHAEAVETLRDLARGDPGNVQAEHALAVALQEMGDALAAAGKYEAALGKYHEAEGVVRNRPETDARIQEFRGGLLFRMGDAWLEAGEANRALPLYESILSVVEKQFAGDASNAECQRGLASVHWAIGRALKKLGRGAEALEHFEKSIPPLMAVIAKDMGNTLFRRTMAEVLVDRGEVLAEAGTFGPGVASVEKGVAMWKEMVEQDPDDAQARMSWCDGLMTMSRAYAAWARVTSKEEAEEFWWRASDAVVKAAQEWERLRGDERITMAMPDEKDAAIGAWLHTVDDEMNGRRGRRPRRS